MPSQDYSKLKSLLEKQETFPTDFTVKFIGKNTARFKTGVEDFEKKFPLIRRQTARESSKGNHLAMTYVILANNAEQIISVLQATGEIDDVMVVL